MHIVISSHSSASSINVQAIDVYFTNGGISALHLLSEVGPRGLSLTLLPLFLLPLHRKCLLFRHETYIYD